VFRASLFTADIIAEVGKRFKVVADLAGTPVSPLGEHFNKSRNGAQRNDGRYVVLRHSTSFHSGFCSSIVIPA
jgi:hypothetical protein